jgi:hypothetical protein
MEKLQKFEVEYDEETAAYSKTSEWYQGSRKSQILKNDIHIGRPAT